MDPEASLGPRSLRLHHVSTPLGFLWILFSAAPPSPSFSAPPLRIPVAQSSTLRPWEAPLPQPIYMPRTPNAPSGMERSRRQNNRRAQTPPHRPQTWTVTHTSTRFLPAFSQGMAVMQNQGAAGTSHPLPRLPQDHPAFRRSHSSRTAGHSLGPLPGFCLSSLSAEKHSLPTAPMWDPDFQNAAALSPKLFWFPHQVPLLSKMSQHRSLKHSTGDLFPSWPSWFSPSPLTRPPAASTEQGAVSGMCQVTRLCL